MISQAQVQTEKPGDYIIRLCKHFGHKIPVNFDETRGRIEFEMGICLLEARDDVLSLRMEGADEAAIERLEGVVARHLERFAWKEAPVIAWQRGTGPAA